MPVPVSVTNPVSAGLGGAVHNSVETAGPWARLKATAAPAGAPAGSAAAAQPVDTNDAPGPAAAACGEASDAVMADAGGGEAAVAVNHLDFAYPGIGAPRRPWLSHGV
eukprot:364264-Chlamydomonas_euryale.AAC.3